MFHCAKAEDVMKEITRSVGGTGDVVAIVDPPRGGLRMHSRLITLPVTVFLAVCTQFLSTVTLLWNFSALFCVALVKKGGYIGIFVCLSVRLPVHTRPSEHHENLTLAIILPFLGNSSSNFHIILLLKTLT